MAIGITPSVGEHIYIDPADVRGPWTITFPTLKNGSDPIDNGDTIITVFTTTSSTLVNFATTAPAKIYFPGETAAASFALDMKGGSYVWEYNSGLGSGDGGWSVISSFQVTELFP